MRVILASASPRRQELLRRILEDFEVVPSALDEPADGRPGRRVVAAAQQKARDVAARASGLVIAADTAVALGPHVLGKPGSRDEAGSMLRRLSGRTHVVFSGLCLVSEDRRRERTAVERTRVRFRTLSEREISRYLDGCEYEDKAGAYAIQGRAAGFVDWICGDYTNVMGLPVSRLTLLLRELGVDV